MRILVTDGDNRAALAVTRSLGRAGHEVTVGERRTPSLAGVSRHCRRHVIYPDPIAAADDFVAAIAATVREHRIEAILPIADITTSLVTSNRERFEPGCAVPFADAAVVARAADKVALMETARQVGVPVPDSVVVTDPAQVPETSWPYPIVIKPWQSRIRTASGWVSTSVSYASSRAALLKDLAARPRHEFPVMLQRRVSGYGMGVFACYHEGRPIAWFSHRRVRERPPWGGVSVVSESIPVDPRAQEYAARLLDALAWQGVAMVEFKVDGDGTPELMEINGRFWGSLQLAIDAGVDFPSLVVQTIERRPFAPQPPYRVGVRSRWFWGDVDALLLTLFGASRGPASWRPRRLAAVAAFLKLAGPDLYYDNPKPGDVRPWLLETRRRFGAAGAAARTVAAAPGTDRAPAAGTVGAAGGGKGL